MHEPNEVMHDSIHRFNCPRSEVRGQRSGRRSEVRNRGGELVALVLGAEAGEVVLDGGDFVLAIGFGGLPAGIVNDMAVARKLAVIGVEGEHTGAAGGLGFAEAAELVGMTDVTCGLARQAGAEEAL